eukprot:5196056-Pyramimonas_sp.AAC.1
MRHDATANEDAYRRMVYFYCSLASSRLSFIHYYHSCLCDFDTSLFMIASRLCAIIGASAWGSVETTTAPQPHASPPGL